MTINEISVLVDKQGMFERDDVFLVKLTQKYIYDNFSFEGFESILNYMCLLLDSTIELDDLEDENDYINFLEKQRNNYSDFFINELVSIINGNRTISNFEITDPDEILFLERLKSLLGIHNTLGYDARNELLKIMDIAVENLEFDIPSYDVGIEL